MQARAHHLIVGGQRSGKSRHAQRLGELWLAQDSGREVTLVATAVGADAEMQARIAQHRRDRPSGFVSLEAPLDLAGALQSHDASQRLLIVDCLTLWLTNWLMPAEPEPTGCDRQGGWPQAMQALLRTLPELHSPVILVSNEVGWGVSPLGAQVRHFVDELGRLNQQVAARCSTLTLMVAGQAWSRPVTAQDLTP